jgi:methionyl-tRNA formyltransferase
MRTLLICHDEAVLDREGLVRWLSSFSHVTGTLVIREPRRRLWKRIRREMTRVGPWRFLDVLAYRAYYRVLHAASDARWEAQALDALRSRYDRPVNAPEKVVDSPNAPDAEAFIRQCRPDLVIARCKTLLKEQVFSIPTLGTFVVHPGICPEYRNAHGCFWAVANGDLENVGATLLRIDRGVDTGPVFGYYRVAPDPARESHVRLQHRAVLESLDAIRDTLIAIEAGRTTPIDTSGRPSAMWGQPWLSAALRARHAAASRRGQPEDARIEMSPAERP